MPPERFPLPGFKVTEDASKDEGETWRRSFTAGDAAAAGYFWVSIDVRSLGSATATSWIKSQDCTWRGSGNAPSGTFELTPPAWAGETKACRYEFGNGTRVFTYAAGARNIGLFVQTSPRNAETTDAAASEFLALIAERQSAIIDRLSPPYAAGSRGGQALHFSPPDVLPAATAGKSYAFSFCQPGGDSLMSPCGPTPLTADPAGGTPPYKFQYGASVDFPPFGITLSTNGLLGGMPYSTTGGQTYHFSVCAVDQKGNSACREVSMSVDGGAPAATASGTPTPEPSRKATPGPTPSPTPRPITMGLKDLAVTLDQLPLSGLKRAEEVPSSAGEWRVRFTPADSRSFGYSWLLIDLVPVRGPKATSWINSQDCVWHSTEGLVPVGSFELTPPPLADGAKACRFEFASGGRLFVYASGTRNVGIYVQAWTNSSPSDVTDTATLGLLRSISERQAAVIDRLDPPGPVLTQSTDSSVFPFDPPPVLPVAIAGQPYKFSFCRSGADTSIFPCQSAIGTSGSASFQFRYGATGGFPPFGITLGKDGLLEGSPYWETVGRDYPFTVCAVDQKEAGVCRDVTLTVGVPPPAPIDGKPEDLAMSVTDLPLSGFKVASDQLVADVVWQRAFVPNEAATAEYQFIIVQLLPIGDTTSADFLKSVNCGAIGAGISSSFGSKSPGVSREVAAPVVGEGVKGCRTDLAEGPRLYIVATSTRNAGVLLLSSPAQPNVTDADATAFLSALGDRQIARLDRLSPPGRTLALTSGAAKFQFNPPAVLPNATAGKPYKFSFCQPEPTSRTSPCGPMPATTAPTGGYPPYHFQYGAAGGFPPFGITLGKDGHLDGTPQAATAGSTYRFTVCAIDLKGDFVCREVSLMVEAPGPVPVTKKPQELVMPLDQFPLPGYKITVDQAVGETWSREFRSDGSSPADYYQVTIDVVPLKDATAAAWIKGLNCQDGGSTAGKNSELAFPAIGDGAKACKQDFGSGSKAYTLYTGTRNVGIFLYITPKGAVADDDAIGVLESMGDRQLAIIGRLSPPGPSLVVTGGAAPFQFNPPAKLPDATAGKKYKFSLCQPEPSSRTSPCGPMPPTTDPSGGSPPYHFQYGTMGGFPPFGITLGKDGHLDGIPDKATAGKTYRFTVCAVDLRGNFVCREVSLKVVAANPPCAGDAYAGTTWTGTAQLGQGPLPTLPFEFTFGTPAYYSTGCVVSVVSVKVSGPGTWAMWSQPTLFSQPNQLQCDSNVCKGFNLSFIQTSGSITFTGGGATTVSRDNVVQMDAAYDDVRRGGILQASMGGYAGLGTAHSGCCGPGSFTATRR